MTNVLVATSIVISTLGTNEIYKGTYHPVSGPAYQEFWPQYRTNNHVIIVWRNAEWQLPLCYDDGPIDTNTVIRKPLSP